MKNLPWELPKYNILYLQFLIEHFLLVICCVKVWFFKIKKHKTLKYSVNINWINNIKQSILICK